MGKISQDFLIHIFDIYPELESIKLELEGQEVEFSEVNYLLPYLAFTNSLDQENRLINVFHPPFSDHHKIIPFYITLAVFKKEIEKIRGTLQPIENDLIVYNNGSKCRLSKIDLNNERILCISSNSTGYMSFDDFLSPFVRTHSAEQRAKYNELKTLVRKYRLIHSDSIRTLLTTPEYIDTDYESGVILFTNKGKFKALFNNLKVSGLSINTRIPVVNAVYERKTNQYRYDYYSELKGKPFILVASFLDIEYINTFRNKFPHLNTIIFDEAENKLDDIKKVIGELKEGLESDEERSLRDVYLLTSDSSLHTYYDLNKWEGYLPFHWISTPKDMSSEESKGHHVHLIDSGQKSELLDKLDNLKRKIVPLFNLINYEDINSFYEAYKKIVIRYYSVFDLQSFHKSVEKLKLMFEDFSQKNLDEEEFDKELISDFRKTTDQLLETEISMKLQYLKEKKEVFDFEDAKLIGIVSRNENKNDQRMLLDWFSQFGVQIEFVDFNQSLKSVKESNFDILIFLEIRKPYINSLFIHEFPGEIYLFLSKYEYSFYKRGFYRITRILNWITASRKRGKLLNINKQNRDEFVREEDLYRLDIGDYVINKELLSVDKEVNDFDEESFSEEEMDLLYDKSENDIKNLIIRSIEGKAGTNKEYTTGGRRGVHRDDSVLIIFEDKTFRKVHSGKNYYKAPDEDVVDINDLAVRADQIKRGDDLLIFNIDQDDLLDLLLNKIKLSDRFKPIYEQSEKWRDNVKALCSEVSYERASELLSKHIARGPATLENWCDGTTLAPQKHQKVIEGLNKIALNYAFNKMEYLSDVDSIKEASSTIKSLLLTLPRKLKKGYIRNRYDLNKEIENEDRDEAILINQILDDVDIKTVSYVLEK